MNMLDIGSVLISRVPSRVLLCPLCLATRQQNCCGVTCGVPLVGLRISVGVVGWDDYFLVTNWSDLRFLRSHNRRDNCRCFPRWRIEVHLLQTDFGYIQRRKRRNGCCHPWLGRRVSGVAHGPSRLLLCAKFPHETGDTQKSEEYSDSQSVHRN